MRILELQRGILRNLRRLRRPAARNRASPTDASMTDLTSSVDGQRARPVLPWSESTETAEDVGSSDESDGSENGELGDIGRAGEGGCDLRVGDTLAFRMPKGGDRRKTSASSDSSGSLSQAQEFSIVVGPSGWLVADATDASVSAHVCLSQHQAQAHGEPLRPAPHQAASTAPPSTAEPRESRVPHHQSDCTEPASGSPGACSSGGSVVQVEPPAAAAALDGSVGHHSMREDVTHDTAGETLHALEARAQRDSSGSYTEELGHAMGRLVLAAEADGVTTDSVPSAPSSLSGAVIEGGEPVPAAGEAAGDTFGDADLIARLERVDALLSGGALCAYAEPAETFARASSGACSDDLEEQGRLGDSEEEEHGDGAREGGE